MSDADVLELISVARGGNYRPDCWRRRHWYSVSRALLSEAGWEVSVAEQLAAIDSLGKTASQCALDFLVKFSEWYLVEETADHCLGGYSGTGKFRLHFPNARGELKALLCGTRVILDWEVAEIKRLGPLKYVPPAGSGLETVVSKAICEVRTTAVEDLSQALRKDARLSSHDESADARAD